MQTCTSLNLYGASTAAVAGIQGRPSVLYGLTSGLHTGMQLQGLGLTAMMQDISKSKKKEFTLGQVPF